MSDLRPHTNPESDPNDAAPPSGESGTVGLHTPRDRTTIPRQFGRYRIQDCLGRGGMGAVFRAHDTQLDRTVALKVPFLGGDDPNARERFYREARAAAALHHANICPVFDVGELHGVPYLTMAFIEGRSLAAALEAGQSFTPRQAAVLVRKLALAMQAAHARGVVHRDLKPANVHVRPDGEPVVMDFGLARRGADPQAEGLTRQGDVIGTVEYMSPEQFEGDNAAVGPASDVYSLGVVLYELLTGRRPFTGSAAGKVAAILFKPPPRPSEVRPGVPPVLEEICLKAMAKRPVDRYPSMAEFAAALAAVLRAPSSGVVAPVARSAAAIPTPPPGPDTRPVNEKAAPQQPDGDDPGFEVVEDATAPAPRPAVRAKLVKSRKKPTPPAYRNPIVLGGAALAAACLSVAVAAVVVRSGEDRPVSPPLPPNPPSDRVKEKAPLRYTPGTERAPQAPRR